MRFGTTYRSFSAEVFVASNSDFELRILGHLQRIDKIQKWKHKAEEAKADEPDEAAEN